MKLENINSLKENAQSPGTCNKGRRCRGMHRRKVRISEWRWVWYCSVEWMVDRTPENWRDEDFIVESDCCVQVQVISTLVAGIGSDWEKMQVMIEVAVMVNTWQSFIYILDYVGRHYSDDVKHNLENHWISILFSELCFPSCVWRHQSNGVPNSPNYV